MVGLGKMVVFTAATLMSLVFAASAWGQSDIEVWNVDEDVSCDLATGGHCAFYAEGDSEISVLPSDTPVSSCADEVFGEIQSDGTGVIEWAGTANGDPGCNVINCQTGDEDRWPILSTTESGAGQINMVVRVCFRALPPSTLEVHCNLNLSVAAPIQTPHDYLFTTSSICFSGLRRVEANWHIESLPLLTDEIEFIHL